MFDAPLDLKNARILVTNDDGVQTPGIELLEKIAREFTDDVWVVGPQQDNTGAGHSITYNAPLEVRQFGPRHFAVDGTPTDCVLLACKELLGGKLPTLLLSGVNPGPNFAENITYSGTISAAFEGTLLGVPSIAFSVNGRKPYCWDGPARFVSDIIRRVTAVSWQKDTLINVNFPNVPAEEIVGMAATRQGRRKYDQRIACLEEDGPRRMFQLDWLLPDLEPDAARSSETDVEAIGNKIISICPLKLGLTDGSLIKDLKRVLD